MIGHIVGLWQSSYNLRIIYWAHATNTPGRAMNLEWSEHIAIDHASIDQDHRYMIYLINLLYNFPDNGHSLVDIDRLFCDLIDFMAVHFANEERIMEEAKYDEMDVHVREHDTLIGVYASYFYEKGARKVRDRQLALEDLSVLLMHHIKTFDLPLALFCKVNKEYALCA